MNGRKKRALLLINPHARRGGESLDAIVGRLHKGGLDITIEPFSALPEIARDIARLRENADMIILCGGDGTIASGAMAVMESGLPLGIFPLGTANDLARTLGIPADLAAAAGIIAAGRTRRIDIGLVNGLPFFNVASIGMSSDLTRQLTHDVKQRLGKLGYLVTALKVLVRARHFRAVIGGNGRRQRVRTLQIAVGNGVYYGGGTVVEENATIDDGMLSLYSLEFRRPWKIALLA